MSYNKLTPAKWLTKLRDGEYPTAGSARKGMGRAHWSKRVKDQMRTYVDLHFEGGKITDEDIAVVARSGNPEPKRLPPKKAKAAKAEPEKTRTPVGKTAHKTASAPTGQSVPCKCPPRTEVHTVDRYGDLRNMICAAREALEAYRVADSIDKNLIMQDELIEAVDLIIACVQELGQRAPEDVRKAVARIGRDRRALEAGGETLPESSPKERRVASPAALPPKSEERLDGVPLESNEEGKEVWDSLAQVHLSKGNGKSVRDA